MDDIDNVGGACHIRHGGVVHNRARYTGAVARVIEAVDPKLAPTRSSLLVGVETVAAPCVGVFALALV